MATITEHQYNDVKKYIQQKLLEKANTAYQYINVAEIDQIPDYTAYKEQVSKVVKKKLVVASTEVQKAFEVFWEAYPGISRFEYMGKKFPGERVLKANKQVCLKLYNDDLRDIRNNVVDLSGSLAPRMILKALQVQLENIWIESYKTGQNRMQYLKSCEVYLRQKAYEPWLNEEMPVLIGENKPVLQNSTDM